MKKTCFFSAMLFMLATQLWADNKLNLKQINSGAFRAESMAVVESLADGNNYAQISSDRKQIQKFSFTTGKQTGVIFDVDKVRGPKIERIDGYVISPDGDKMLIQTNTRPIYRRTFTATYYIYDAKNNKMEPLSDGGPQQTPIWSPDGNVIAFVRDNNIFLVKLLYGNAESQITKDGKFNEIINGVPDWVYEEEFSTNSSLIFTADSKQVVWIRYDESKVKEYSMPLFKGLSPARQEYATYPGFYTYKYPKAGEDNSKVSVLSFDIKSKQTRTLQVPLDADGYIPRLKSTSDPSKVAVFTMNRHQDVLKIYMCNPLSTMCQLVVEDKVDKYINENVLAQTTVTPGHIVMTSERDGYNHIYIYTLTGQLQRKITPANTVVTDVYGYDEKTGDVYYAALAQGPADQKVYVSHKNGKTDCLTPQDGWSSAIFSANFKYFICNWSDINTPPVYSLCNNQGKKLTTLIENKQLEQKYNAYEMGKKEMFTFTTGEGVKLYGYMIKPADFDPAKKYPVVMYQYGGPGAQQVKNTWNIGMSGQGAILEQYLCQQGFITVCVDNRGTGGRGAEFEKCTYLRLGELEARDQVETALWLGKQSYIDKDRIAIWGWSYGGWNTLMSMSEGRPVFRAGIAIAPPTNWRFYDTIYTERFMRTPQENQEGYDEVCPIARASKLSGALLICHGLADDNVHYQNTAEYSEALVQADKDFREIIYTNRNHGISGGNTRNHLFRQCVNFFNTELK